MGGDLLEEKTNNQKALERLEAILKDIAYGKVTLKIQNNQVVQIEKQETELIE